MHKRFKKAVFWLVVFCLLPALPLSAQSGGSPFFFVQITDTHIGIRENDLRTRRVIEAVNALPMKLACVVHTGDVYDRSVRNQAGAAARARDLFSTLKVPIYFLPGNHEIDLFGETEETKRAFTEHFSPLVYSKPVAGTVFVFAYSDPLREGVALGGFDPLAALRREMAGAGGRPVLLFHHGPSVWNFYSNRFHPGWDPAIKEKWVALVNGFNVKAVITGHYHRDEQHWLGNVPLYVSGPVAEKYGRQACFRIYEYRDGTLSYTTQYLE